MSLSRKMSSEFKYGLVLPEEIVNEITRALVKRKGKNVPQTWNETFEGDTAPTKFWLEQRGEEVVLMSQMEGREFAQEVWTPSEMAEKMPQQQAVSFRGKLLEVFKELGCPANEAFENALNLIRSHKLNPKSFNSEEASVETKRLLAMLFKMKQDEVKTTTLRILPCGDVVLVVDEENREKMRSIQRMFGLGPPSEETSDEESEENPRNEPGPTRQLEPSP